MYVHVHILYYLRRCSIRKKSAVIAHENHDIKLAQNSCLIYKDSHSLATQPCFFVWSANFGLLVVIVNAS